MKFYSRGSCTVVITLWQCGREIAEKQKRKYREPPLRTPSQENKKIIIYSSIQSVKITFPFSRLENTHGHAES